MEWISFVKEGGIDRVCVIRSGKDRETSKRAGHIPVGVIFSSFFSSSLLQSFDFRLFAVHSPPILAGAFCVQWAFKQQRVIPVSFLAGQQTNKNTRVESELLNPLTDRMYRHVRVITNEKNFPEQ
jgi:hypothetical protein